MSYVSARIQAKSELTHLPGLEVDTILVRLKPPSVRSVGQFVLVNPPNYVSLNTEISILNHVSLKTHHVLFMNPPTRQHRTAAMDSPTPPIPYAASKSAPASSFTAAVQVVMSPSRAWWLRAHQRAHG